VGLASARFRRARELPDEPVERFASAAVQPGALAVHFPHALERADGQAVPPEPVAQRLA
jgi:hypothetical protein